MPERDRHGVPGQLNVYVLDVDSEVTGYGRHNRLVVFGSLPGEPARITIREDVRGLPMSTDQDRRKVANHPGHRLHGNRARLTYVGSEPYDIPSFGPAIEHVYRY